MTNDQVYQLGLNPRNDPRTRQPISGKETNTGVKQSETPQVKQPNNNNMFTLGAAAVIAYLIFS